MKKLTRQEILDILYGCTILGTGGGGDLDLGLEVMQLNFNQKKELQIIAPEDVPDDAYLVSPYMCGAPGSMAETDSKSGDTQPFDFSIPILAFKTLESYFGKKFFGIIATELGGANTAIALHVACQLGLPIVDGDPSGRSVPEIHHTSFYVKNVPITPIALATKFGDTIIIKDTVNNNRAEELVRAVAQSSGNLVGVADHPITGATLKEAIIPHTLSFAMMLGKTLRVAKDKREDVVQKLVTFGKGKILFNGKVREFKDRIEGGFNHGEIILKGIKDYDGDTYKILYKNEHIISYKNDKVDVSVPDLICVVDENCMPVTNPNYTIDQELTIFVLPAPPIWRTTRGLEIFGPRSFGFNIDYIPFDESNAVEKY